jgi:predicted transglutaminase-like cysteine proteinase
MRGRFSVRHPFFAIAVVSLMASAMLVAPPPAGGSPKTPRVELTAAPAGFGAEIEREGETCPF